MAGKRIKVGLAGVPETMLWPLWNRAAEHTRRDRLIDDPMAAELVARIDYDFAASFGKPSVLHAIRARVGDDLVKAYLKDEPAGTVVALGEGLETQLWRAGSPGVRWMTVDLPEAIAVRRELLPDDPRATLIGCSALDEEWMNAVPESPAPFISAAGLLMYFHERDVRGLLERIADRMPSTQLFFDTIPPWLSRRTLKGFRVTRAYTAPPMPWGIGIGAIRPFIGSVPGWNVKSAETYADRFARRMPVFHALSRLGWARNAFAPGLVHAIVEPDNRA